MNALEAALRRIAADLDLHHRQWALVGGFAVSARAEPRFTRDIDVAVMVDNDADSEGPVRSLLASRYQLMASAEQDQTGRLATVRLACPAGDGNVVVDLLLASSGIESEIAQAAETTVAVLLLTEPAAGSSPKLRPRCSSVPARHGLVIGPHLLRRSDGIAESGGGTPASACAQVPRTSCRSWTASSPALRCPSEPVPLGGRRRVK